MVPVILERVPARRDRPVLEPPPGSARNPSDRGRKVVRRRQAVAEEEHAQRRRRLGLRGPAQDCSERDGRRRSEANLHGPTLELLSRTSHCAPPTVDDAHADRRHRDDTYVDCSPCRWRRSASALQRSSCSTPTATLPVVHRADPAGRACRRKSRSRRRRSSKRQGSPSFPLRRRAPGRPDRAAVLDSTEVSNPLFPIGELHSAILNGTVDGQRFKTETTLLPDTRIMEWSNGQCVEVLVSQYLAYLDGRIEEAPSTSTRRPTTARRGIWARTSSTTRTAPRTPRRHLVCRHRRAGGDDHAGGPAGRDAYRPENIAGLVFEEVTVKEVGKTVRSPRPDQRRDRDARAP